MTLSVTELLKKVRRLEIVSNRFANDLFAGQYKSVFRGRGMEFNEVREYQPGDDIRSIDWNVTARAGRPYVKRFVEERELTVLFMVDISASGIFGTNRSKWDASVEAAATLMFSALKNNDKVGLLTFCDKVENYYKPAKGKANILHLIRELLQTEPIARPADLNAALEYVNRILKRRAVIFLLSDFLTPQPGRELIVCRRKHDLIALSTVDAGEREFPQVGFLTLFDPETGQEIEVDTGDPKVRHFLADQMRNKRNEIAGCLKKSKVDLLEFGTEDDFTKDLRRFFRARAKRAR